MLVKHNHEPWEFMEIEDFLPQKEFQNIQELAKEELNKYYVEGQNTPRGKYVRYLDEDILPQANDVFGLLKGREATGEVKKIVHWAITPPGVHYPTHIDNRSRLSTIAFYVAPEKNIGTIVCTNPSKNDNGDHNAPDLPTESEIELEWKPNKVFLHCGGAGKWHRYYGGDEPRIIISTFVVQVDKIKKGHWDLDHLIDL